MPYRKIADNFATLGRELGRQPTPDSTLTAVVDYAVAAIEGAQEASITVKAPNGRFRTIATTGDLPMQVDAIQYEVGEGPCVDAQQVHHVFRSDDLSTDERWPLFGPKAVASTEVLSMMAHRLYLEDDDTLGTLNLYSRQLAAFASLDLTTLDLLATLSAIALAKAAAQDQTANLQEALATNRDIGVAIGIVMKGLLIPKDQAFDLLRVVSQRSNRKLRDVALDVIDRGELEDGPAASTMLNEIDLVLHRRPRLGSPVLGVANLRAHLNGQPMHTLGASTLTAAELRILPLLSTHLTLSQVAARLNLSRSTIKSHVESIYRKLHVHSRAEAVAGAQELGLIGESSSGQ
ncbi:ANTAR domain-containing protein [Jatrophihabitans sp. DSM 45814]